MLGYAQICFRFFLGKVLRKIGLRLLPRHQKLVEEAVSAFREFANTHIPDSFRSTPDQALLLKKIKISGEACPIEQNALR